MHHARRLAAVFAVAAPLVAQHERGAGETRTPFVAPASAEAQQQIAGFRLDRGLVCDLVAAEPDLCNVVAFAIDGKGRVYVAETFRINDGVFDTRNFMQWKDADLACLTVADRLRKYETHIAADIPKYAAFAERVRMLADTDRDGTLDRSTVFADGFADLADGIASGVLPVGDDVWLANIPKLWRLRDTNGDGRADERHAVHDGYGVHTSLIGHDLHGLVVGPDRRLWFSIGDRGFHVEHEGRTHAYPHEGAVLRCELDGSGLEVVHRGLRNPQELAFDQWGDLFTGDNNSDGGDRARLVQIVPGADSGWRIGYQWLSDRGAWNRERLWQPRHPGQSARILPPIANFADGPSGLAYDPGVGLPERYRDCFFLCDFRGGRSYSGVHAFRLERRGAGFEMAGTQQPIWSVLATDVDFAPDGSLWVSDWVSGWNKTGKGRLYRVRTPQMANDMALRAGAALLGSDLRQRPAGQLRSLLAHADRRVRQAAQFALVDQGATDVLEAVAAADDSRLARLHAIWGLGVLGRKDIAAVAPLVPLLDDGDADVRAMAARVLGDVREGAAGKALVARLRDGNARVRREAALALTRLGETAPKDAAPALLDALRHEDDHDAVLRHALAAALAATADAATLHAHQHDASTAVRRGVLLALERRGDPRLAESLRDPDPSLRSDAARAIYERPVDAAMPALAALAGDDEADVPAVDWRAINANRMLGAVENGETLVHFAGSRAQSAAMRKEAIAILAEWPRPHGQDRVFGNWRPCEHPSSERVVASFAAAAPALLDDPDIAASVAGAVADLSQKQCAGRLAEVVGRSQMTEAARVAALDALARLDAPELEAALLRIDADAPVALRKRAVELLSRSAPGKAVPVLASLLENASTAERQAALTALGELQDPAAAALLGDWLDRDVRGEVPAALRLELLEAAGKHGDPGLERRLAARRAADAANHPPGGDPVAEHRECLEGGDAEAGRKVFFEHEATRCTRCHTLAGEGGNAGPALDGIGARSDRTQLLESLLAPSARIAAGFGSTTVDLHDGSMLLGFVTKDQDGTLTLVDSSGKSHEIAWSRIARRTPNGTSAMPAMGGSLSRRQLRDLVEFLASKR